MTWKGALLINVVLILALFGAKAWSAQANEADNEADTDSMDAFDKRELFEFDLKIPEEMIRQHYNITDFENTTGEEFHLSTSEERAVTSSAVALWENGVVYYHLDTSISESVAKAVQAAIKEWEDNTCLKFVPKDTNTKDYIRITQMDDGGYYSTSVGKAGGEQIINLESNAADYIESVVHVFGHAIGFWHEQSRPDRDSYVQVNYDNIKPGKAQNFMKRKQSEVTSPGVEYNYRSIMHYPLNAFSTCMSCQTLEVTNQTAYTGQGSPTIGQTSGFSALDIQQAQLLYSCPGMQRRITRSHSSPNLQFYVRYGRNLPDRDGWFNKSDPYVQIIVFRHGLSVRKTTFFIQGNHNPTWNQWIHLGRGDWILYEIRVWDKDIRYDDPMSNPQHVAITRGSHRNLRHHCHSGEIVYDYYYN